MTTENSTKIKKHKENQDITHELRFVEDDRPSSLKKLDKTVADRTVKSLGDYELKRKSKLKTNPYNYDVEGTKYYFSTKSESAGRILIVISQIGLLAVLLAYVPSLGQIAAQFIVSLLSKLNTPFTGPIVAIGQPIVIILIIILVISWLTVFFISIIPILVVRTIRTVRIWNLIITILDTINGIFAVGIAILQVLYIRGSVGGLKINPYILPAIILGMYILFIIGSGILRTDRKKYQYQIENKLANEIRLARG